jgi:PAS domain S-box-containing protein
MNPEKIDFWRESRSLIDDQPELLLDEHIPLLTGVIWVILVGSLVFAALLIDSPQEYLRRIYGATGLAGIAAASLVVLYRAGPIAAVRLLVFAGFLLATGVALFGEGLRSPILLAYPLVILFSGWLLGARYCLALFMASAVAVVVMAFGQHYGAIAVVKPAPPVAVAVAQLIALSISTLMTLSLLQVFRSRHAEERRLNAVLQASELRFRDVLQSVPSVAVQGYCEDGTTHYWNSASEKLYGYSSEEAIGRNLLELIIPPEMRLGVQEAMRKMFDSGQPIPAGELSLMRKDGSQVDVFSSHAYVHVPGHAPEMFCVDIDLSERKRFEEALRFTRTSVEAASDAIFWITPDARIIDVNAAACVSLGYTREELLALSVADVDINYDQAVWPGHFAELRQKGTIKLESVQRGKDGRLFPVEVVANYVPFGDLERNCAFVRDISERKQAEKELKIIHERLELALIGGNLGLWDWQTATGEVLFSERWYSMLGYTSEEFSPNRESWANIIHPDDLASFNVAFDSHLKGHTQAYECEYRVRHNDGHWIWLHDRGRVVEWDKESVPVRAVGTFSDITQRKVAEQALEKLAQVDTLTGLANRRHFMNQAEQELSRNVRYGGPLSLLMIDIDHFKNVNDTYGHQIGDLVLQKLGAVFVETLRDIDRVGRVGGEEFAVVLPQTDEVRAIEVAEACANSLRRPKSP